MLGRPLRSRLLSEPLVLALACAAVGSLTGTNAQAKRDGITATSCSGCHSSAQVAQIEASSQPAQFEPGDEITVTVSVRFPGSKVGGVFIAEPGIGQLRALDADLKVVSGGLAHSAPKAAVDGRASFRFGWRAPSTPGSVHFEVAALSGNGNGQSSGDATATDTVSFVYGCTPETFYRDLDGDGFGAERASPIVDCAGAPPSGYSKNKDDCDDTYERVFPGAPEICNMRDDDCDGEIDEGAPPVELWPDEDGDGYYGERTGTPVIGCAPLAGYAADPGDCAPRDPTRHPGATEVCNLLDDNCDNRVDERVRPQCGVGLCLRNSPTCEFADCRPGTPMPEVCNLLDDDCNGIVDDGSPCAEGMSCVDGSCVPDGAPTGGSGGTGNAPNGGGPSTGTPSSGAGAQGSSASGGVSSVPGLGGGPGNGSGASGGAPSPAQPSAGAAASPSASSDSSGCSLGRAGGGTLAVLCLGVLAAARARRKARPSVGSARKRPFDSSGSANG